MNKGIATIILIALLIQTGSTPAQASRNFCNNIIKKLFKAPETKVVIPTEYPKPTLSTTESWFQETPYTVTGTNQKLSFSYDGELAWDELLTFIKKDEESLKEFNRLFGDKKFNKHQLMNFFKLTEKQFDTFVIPKKSPLSTRDFWKPTELPPRYFAFLMDKKGESYALDSLAKETSKSMNRRGFNTQGLVDSGFVEVAHSSFDLKPAVFNQTMRNLEKDFPKSTMHMHIGIPDVVSEMEAFTVARAVESKTILSIAENNFKSELSFHNSSTLKLKEHFDKQSAFRGVIRLGFNEFKGAHNLEIRQYETMDDGLHLMKFSADLSMNPKALYQIDHFNPMFIEDKYTNNLNGALKYMGMLFRNKNTAESIAIGDEMLALSSQIESEGIISDQMRSKVQKFIKKNDLLKKMDDLSLYMKVE